MTSETRAPSPDSTECVFCTRREQPEILFETRSLYVMPDKFPTRPGHALIISKAHLPCLAAVPELVAELEEAKARVEQFLVEAYPAADGGAPAIYAMEHGVVGQTVFHAHLHVVPGPYVPIPPAYAAHPDVEQIEGWAPVLARYAACAQYRLVEYGGRRYVVDGRSESLAIARPWLAEFTGMTWKPEGGWAKYTTREDVRELERRWRTRSARAS